MSSPHQHVVLLGMKPKGETDVAEETVTRPSLPISPELCAVAPVPAARVPSSSALLRAAGGSGLTTLASRAPSAAAITDLFDPSLDDDDSVNNSFHTLPIQASVPVSMGGGVAAAYTAQHEQGGEDGNPLSPPVEVKRSIHRSLTLSPLPADEDPLGPGKPNSSGTFFLLTLAQLLDAQEKAMAASHSHAAVGHNGIVVPVPLGHSSSLGAPVMPLPATEATIASSSSAVEAHGVHRPSSTDYEGVGSPATALGLRSFITSATATPGKLWRTLFQGEEGAAAGRESVAAGYSSDTDTNRRAFRGAVPGQSKPVLCSGFLKKAKDLNIGMWHSKYVQLRPGALVYSSDAQHIDDPKFQSIIPFDAKTCAFRPVNTWFGGKEFIFEVSNSSVRGSRRYWKAPSEEVRTMWLEALDHAVKSAASSEEQSLIAKCEGIQASIAKSEGLIGYLAVVGTFGSDGIRVPYSWASQQLAKQQQAFRCTLTQTIKDFEREKVKVNGQDVPGGAAGLMGHLCSLVQSGGTQRPLTELDAFLIVKDILLQCNRTSFGGDSYEIISMLFGKEGMSIVCPFAAEEEPLQFTVSPSPSAVSPLPTRSAVNSAVSSPLSPLLSESRASVEKPRHRRHVSAGGQSGAIEAIVTQPDPARVKGDPVIPHSPTGDEAKASPRLKRLTVSRSLRHNVVVTTTHLFLPGLSTPPDTTLHTGRTTLNPTSPTSSPPPVDAKRLFIRFEACSTYRLMDVSLSDDSDKDSQDTTLAVLSARVNRGYVCEDGVLMSTGDDSMTITCLSCRSIAPVAERDIVEPPVVTAAARRPLPSETKNPFSYTPGHVLASADLALVSPGSVLSPFSYSADEFASNSSALSLSPLHDPSALPRHTVNPLVSQPQPSAPPQPSPPPPPPAFSPPPSLPSTSAPPPLPVVTSPSSSGPTSPISSPVAESFTAAPSTLMHSPMIHPSAPSTRPTSLPNPLSPSALRTATHTRLSVMGRGRASPVKHDVSKSAKVVVTGTVAPRHKVEAGKVVVVVQGKSDHAIGPRVPRPVGHVRHRSLGSGEGGMG